jgi:phage terminase small subunit
MATAKKKKKKDVLGNPKHKAFVLEYIKYKNATKAYAATYPNVSYDTAKSNGHKLLTNTYIQDEIQKHLDKTWAEKEKKISNLFDNLLEVADADISDFLDENGDVKVDEFKKLNTRVIAEYNQTISDTKDGQNVKRSIKLKDSLKAVAELTKILGMIKEKVEHSGTIEIIPTEDPDDK